MMGYHTPNIDRIANEGGDLYRLLRPAIVHSGTRGLHHRPEPDPHRPAQGRPARPKEGLSDKDPTLAEILKPEGYVTGQFGKNHLGDRNEFLPTVHGFDEFFGNLYHLNAEEEPENPDYPKSPEYPNSERTSAPAACSNASRRIARRPATTLASDRGASRNARTRGR